MAQQKKRFSVRCAAKTQIATLRAAQPVTLRLFTIYTGKLVASRFGQIVSKFPYWEIPFGTGAYHLQESLPFTKNFAQRRLTRTSQNKSFN